MLDVVDDEDNSRSWATGHGMGPTYGANIFIFCWLFSLLQVCGKKAAKYFRTIISRSWTISFKHFLPFSSQKNAEESHNGIDDPHSNQENPIVIIEHTQSLGDEHCNCVVCANTDDDISLSHSYTSSCTSCSASSSSLSFSEEYADGDNEGTGEGKMADGEIRASLTKEKMEENIECASRASTSSFSFSEDYADDDDEEEEEEKEGGGILERLDIINNEYEEETMADEDMTASLTTETVKNEMEKMEEKIECASCASTSSFSFSEEYADDDDEEEEKEVEGEEGERLDIRDEEDVKEEEEEEDKIAYEEITSSLTMEAVKSEMENMEEKIEFASSSSSSLSFSVDCAAADDDEEEVGDIRDAVKLRERKQAIEKVKEVKMARKRDIEDVREEVKIEDEVKDEKEEDGEKKVINTHTKEGEEEEEERAFKNENKELQREVKEEENVREEAKREVKEEEEIVREEEVKIEEKGKAKAKRKAGKLKLEVRNEKITDDIKNRMKNENEENCEEMKEKTKIEIKEEKRMKEKEEKIVPDENKKDEISNPHLDPHMPKLSAYSQFSQIPSVPTHSPREGQRKSRVKELATWFEKYVIVHPDPMLAKEPDHLLIPSSEPVLCPKTYDDNNNKRIVGELVNFFCSQKNPRPRPQPINEVRVNVLNLIETFEKRSDNKSKRHYPYIPLHTERFV